ncbi:MAG TPA: C40 family peptidase [Balneolales bacterium]|nr:C40 family peptidase [Balneolales bacterium]
MTDSESSTEPAFLYARSGIVPVRREANDASEMLTQLLLGETAKVIDARERWLHITADYDGYSGWVNRNQMQYLSRTEYINWRDHRSRQRSPYAGFRIRNNRDSLWVPSGATVIIENGRVYLPDAAYDFVSEPRVIKHNRIIETASEFLGTPYLWGGRTDTGIDCSGFIQTVFAIHGSVLPRDSRDQFKIMEPYTTDINEAKPGDVIYFNTSGGPITHVGLYIGDGILLHASGNVKRNYIGNEPGNKTHFHYNQRLAEHIKGIQSGQSLYEYGQKKLNSSVLN